VVTNGVSFDRNFKEIVFIVAPDHFERIKKMVHRLFCPSAQLAIDEHWSSDQGGEEGEKVTRRGEIGSLGYGLSI
jgi:hypothetical protein